MIHLASPIIGDEEIEAVTRVMRSGMLAQGKEVAAFEDEFAAAFDADHAAAVSNGTTALIVALQAGGIQPGDEVIVPSFTFAATANAVALIGATPVFADCDPDTFCIDPVHAAELITEETRAIIAVHLYGHMAPMRELRELAIAQDLFLIEDAAQAHGATRDGLPVGALSDLSTYSFYPTKNMTTGEGGMVTGRNPALIDAGEAASQSRDGGAVSPRPRRYQRQDDRYRCRYRTGAALEDRWVERSAAVRSRRSMTCIWRGGHDTTRSPRTPSTSTTSTRFAPSDRDEVIAAAIERRRRIWHLLPDPVPQAEGICHVCPRSSDLTRHGPIRRRTRCCRIPIRPDLTENGNRAA